MKAVICTQYGSPEVLKVTEIKKPIPKDDEILVRIKATTVSAADIRIRSFTVPPALWIPARIALGITKPKQKVLGVEFSGIIEARGKNVNQFKIGEEVYAASLQKFGGYAEYITLSERDTIAKKPQNISFEEAASLPIGARTALHFLKKANIKPGQSILIYGASGSVGTYAVQLAKYFGANVTGVSGTNNLHLVKSLGADKVLDYTQKDFEQQLEKYDVIFVAVDKIPFSTCTRHLKENGTYINISIAAKTPEMLWASFKHGKNIIAGGNVPETADALHFIKTIVEAGKLIPVIDKNYSLQEIIQAHRYVEKGHKKGNVVVQIQ